MKKYKKQSSRNYEHLKKHARSRVYDKMVDGKYKPKGNYTREHPPYHLRHLKKDSNSDEIE